jgi:excalibur calcium-binding domain-containing protein
MMRRATTLFLFGAVFAAGGAAANASHAAIPARWKNCTAVNRRFPHGVGKLHAHDNTTGVPVTNFRHSTRLYNTAMSYNRGLDRDKDGIACEKH